MQKTFFKYSIMMGIFLLIGSNLGANALVIPTPEMKDLHNADLTSLKIPDKSNSYKECGDQEKCEAVSGTGNSLNWERGVVAGTNPTSNTWDTLTGRILNIFGGIGNTITGGDNSFILGSNQNQINNATGNYFIGGRESVTRGNNNYHIGGSNVNTNNIYATGLITIGGANVGVNGNGMLEIGLKGADNQDISMDKSLLFGNVYSLSGGNGNSFYYRNFSGEIDDELSLVKKSESAVIFTENGVHINTTAQHSGISLEIGGGMRVAPQDSFSESIVNQNCEEKLRGTIELVQGSGNNYCWFYCDGINWELLNYNQSAEDNSLQSKINQNCSISSISRKQSCEVDGVFFPHESTITGYNNNCKEVQKTCYNGNRLGGPNFHLQCVPQNTGRCENTNNLDLLHSHLCNTPTLEPGKPTEIQLKEDCNSVSTDVCTFVCDDGYNYVAGKCIAQKTITINLDANGGIGTPSSVSRYLQDKYFNLPFPTRTGHGFNGWYTAKTGGTKITETTIVTNDQTHTLFAQWNTTSITCNSGYYLPGEALTCAICLSGNYCTGGTFNYSELSQGLTSCPLYYTSDQGKSKESDCYINVNPGNHVKTAKAKDTACENGEYTTNHKVYYGNTSNCNPCTTITNSTRTSNGTGATSCKFECNTGYKKNTTTRTCDAETYTITYTLNGGTVSPANPTTYTIESSNINLNKPTKNGYIFKGWTGSNGNTPSTSVTISKGSTGNKSYTANWQACTACNEGAGATCTLSVVNNQCVYTTACTNLNYTITNSGTYHPSCSANAYTITYTLNGGTVSPANPTSYTVETDTFTLKNPIKNGSIFKGWTGSNGSTPSTSVTITKGTTGNKSYTANWQACTACNEGAGATCTLSVVNNQCVYTTACTNSNYTITNSGTYHPSCSANTYNITYNLNNGSHGSSHPTSATYDESFTVSNPTRNGYKFKGWEITGMDTTTHTIGTSTSNSTSIDSTKETTFKNLTAVKNGTITFTALWESDEVIVTFEAEWTDNTCTITFDLQGGTSTCLTTSTSCGTSSTEGTVFSGICNSYTDNATFRTSEAWWRAGRNGYIFSGWYTAPNGGTRLSDDTIRTVSYNNQTYYAQRTPCSNSANVKSRESGCRISSCESCYELTGNQCVDTRDGVYGILKYSDNGTRRLAIRAGYLKNGNSEHDGNPTIFQTENCIANEDTQLTYTEAYCVLKESKQFWFKNASQAGSNFQTELPSTYWNIKKVLCTPCNENEIWNGTDCTNPTPTQTSTTTNCTKKEISSSGMSTCHSSGGTPSYDGSKYYCTKCEESSTTTTTPSTTTSCSSSSRTLTCTGSCKTNNGGHCTKESWSCSRDNNICNNALSSPATIKIYRPYTTNPEHTHSARDKTFTFERDTLSTDTYISLIAHTCELDSLYTGTFVKKGNNTTTYSCTITKS